MLSTEQALGFLSDYREGKGNAIVASSLLLEDSMSALSVACRGTHLPPYEWDELSQLVRIKVAKLMAAATHIPNWTATVITLARNTFLNFMRAKRAVTFEELGEEHMPTTPSSNDMINRQEVYDELRKCCSMLPADEAFIIDKLYFAAHPWTQQQIAAELQCSQQKIGHNHQAILVKLKDMLQMADVKREDMPWRS